jgi:SAM domain (Sterile alpha motif)
MCPIDRSDVDLLVCRSADRATGHVPQPTHYPTKPCETRPWTSAGGSRNLGLGKYEAAFRHNAIDEQVLRDLTAENLKEIGATVGDRRKLQLDRGVGRPVALGGASFAAQSAERPKTPEASAERRPLTS